MTKKFIVNGIDVTECKNLDTFADIYGEDNAVTECMLDSCDCEDNPNCRYKRLVRKHQISVKN